MSRPKFGSQTQSNNFSKPEERQEIGAIWKRTTRDNRDYLTIKIGNIFKLQELLKDKEEINLIAFSNKTKSEKGPNFIIFEENK